MRQEWRLRSVLMAMLIFASLITFCVVSIAILAYRLPQIDDASRRQARQQAASMMFAVGQVTDGLEARFRTLQALVGDRRGENPQHLLDATVAEGGFAAIYLIHASGTVAYKTVPAGNPVAGTPVDFSGNSLFRLARSSDQPVWSDRYLSAQSGDYAMGLAGRSGPYVLLAETNSHVLAKLVESLSQQNGQATLVLDRRGDRVADANMPEANRLKNWGKEVDEWLLTPDRDPEILLDGQRQFLGIARSEKLKWTCLVAVPAGMDNPRYSTTVWLVLLGFVCSLLLAAILAPLWSRLIAAPVQRMARHAREIAAGNYGKKVPRGRVAELNVLALDLERMGESIVARQLDLARSEERLRATLENSPSVAIRWVDGEGTVLLWNHASELIYGFSEQDALGRKLDRLLFSAEQQQRFAALLQQIDQTGMAQGPDEWHLRHRDGRELVVLSTLFAIPGQEGERQYVCMDIDITASRDAAAALRESEQRFQGIFEGSPLPMAVVACDAAPGEEPVCRMVDANLAWLTEFARRREDVIDLTLDELNLWQSPETADRMRSAFLSQRITTIREEWLLRANGSPILCEMSARPIAIGSRSLVIWVLNDVTEKRVVEEELRQLNVELEARVARRTQDLARANIELSSALENLKLTQGELANAEKLAALGGLVAGVAHDLNTPIGNGVMAMSTLNDDVREFRRSMAGGLRRSTLETFVSAVATAASIGLRNLERAADLVTSFKQVAVDQTSSQRRQFNLGSTVREILVTLQPMLKRLPYEICVDMPEDIEMDSYPGPLGQVLTNFINNAVIHAFEDRDSGLITLSARALDDDRVAISVRDNGAGFSESMRPHLFQPFATTRRGQGGTGLGLHISYNLVTGMLGGEISMSSEPGQGTEFVVVVPKVAPKSSDHIRENHA